MATRKAPAAKKQQAAFRHAIGKEYVKRMVDKKLVRFTVVERLAGGADSSGEGVEVLRTARGGFVLWDEREPGAREYGFFKSVEDLRNSLDLDFAVERQLFVALGGSLEKAIPEV